MALCSVASGGIAVAVTGLKPHNLDAVRDLAVRLGLKPREWPRFLEEARALEIGDGAPPLI